MDIILFLNLMNHGQLVVTYLFIYIHLAYLFRFWDGNVAMLVGTLYSYFEVDSSRRGQYFFDFYVTLSCCLEELGGALIFPWLEFIGH